MEVTVNQRSSEVSVPDTLSECELAVNNSGIFPGAYNNRMLLNSCANANTFTSATEDDCYSAIAQLQKALISGFVANYKNMPMAAMRVMALEPDGARKINTLETVLIYINENKLEIVRNLLASQTELTSLSFSEAGKVCIQNISDSGSLQDECQLSASVSTSQLAGIKSTSLSSVGTELQASSDTLEITVALIVKANFLECCWSNTQIDREILRKLNQELTEEFLRFTDFWDSQLENAGLMQASKFRLQQLSPRIRTINLIDGLQEVEHKNRKLLARMHEIYKEEPFCGPLVVITAANGRLFYNEGFENSEIIPTVADDLMCRDSSFLAITRQGRISFVHMHYDYGWGKLSATNPVDLNKDFASGTVPRKDDYAWKQLSTVVNLFPSLDFERINSELANLQQDQNFEAYLSDKSQRYGPRQIKNKSWLDKHDPGYNPQMTDFLASIYLNLIDSNRLQENGTQHSGFEDIAEAPDRHLSTQTTDLRDHKQYQWLSKMLANSYMSNSQGEHFLIHFMQKAIESGKTLGNFRLENYAEMKAFDWLKNLEQREALLAVGLVFDLKEKNPAGVRLTEFGVAYLLSLLNPAYKFHHTGDDCVELQELRAKRDLYRY